MTALAQTAATGVTAAEGKRPGRGERQNRASQPRQKKRRRGEALPSRAVFRYARRNPGGGPVRLARAALGSARNASRCQPSSDGTRPRAPLPRSSSLNTAQRGPRAGSGGGRAGGSATRKDGVRPSRDRRGERPPASARGSGEGSPWRQTPPVPSRCSWWSSPGGCWPGGRPAPALSARPRPWRAGGRPREGRAGRGRLCHQPRRGGARGQPGHAAIGGRWRAARSPGAAATWGLSALAARCVRPCCCCRQEIAVPTLVGIWITWKAVRHFQSRTCEAVRDAFASSDVGAYVAARVLQRGRNPGMALRERL